MKFAFEKVSRLLLVVVAALLMNAQFVSAQEKAHKKGGVPSQEQVSKKVAKISEGLALNESKTKDLSAIFTNYYDGLRADKLAGKVSPENMKASKQDFNKKVKSLLSPEEFEKYKTLNSPKGKAPMANKVKKVQKIVEE